ncbi:MAG: hypothetical protein U5J64_09255 [Halobacteriales archaeon]|nr:hypothetical protein [Halobacteriales archaeon]
MDKTKTGVAAVLVIALVAGVGYAYITGMGPLEENPTAGLDEPPETETTYSFGEVSETGSDGGDVDDRTDDMTGDSDDAGDDDRDGDGTDGGAEETESQNDEPADEKEDGDGETDVGTQTETGGDEGTDDGDEGGDSHRGGGGGDGDGVDNSGDDTDRRSTGTGTTTLQANAERAEPPFVPELENMEDCGETCREATVALRNDMNVAAEDVVVYVRLYAGDSTDSDNVVWGENRNLGTLAPGEVYRTTESVDLTPQQANKVREKDGRVTVKATVESEQATATFVERDDVK